MGRIGRYASGALLALALTGCMSAGTKVSDEQISKFVKGKTTEREVIAALGPPDFTDRSSDGRRADSYNYAKVAPSAQSYIPIIGGFIASSSMESRLVHFTFTAGGILEDWSASGMNQDVRNGFANQK